MEELGLPLFLHPMMVNNERMKQYYLINLCGNPFETALAASHLIYGGVLLVLAGLARQWLKTEPLARDSYLAQGLLLVTIGLISKFSGLQLALVLGVESVFLLWAAQQTKNPVLSIGSYVSAGLSVAWGIDGMRLMEPSGVYLGVGLGGMMLR